MELTSMTARHTAKRILRAGISSLGAFSAVAAVLTLGAAGARAQQTPNAVVYDSTALVNINGNAGHIAANNLGDAFYVSQTDNVAYWLPRGSKTPIALVTGLSGGRSVSVDPSNNVYVSSNYSGRVIEVPYVNGTYATNTANSSGLPTCTVAPTSPCLAFGNGAGATGYYLQTGDVTFDQTAHVVPAKGTVPAVNDGPNAYVVDERDNNCDQSTGAKTCNSILQFTPTGGGAYTATVLVTGLPQTNNGQIAAGPKGDVYYADGTSVYFIAAGTTTATTIGSGLTNPTGVTTDRYGDLFITNASAPNEIVELPAVNGVAQPSGQFTFLGIYSANGVAFDGLGHMFYTGYSTQTNLNEASIGTFGLGAAAIGTPVSATPTTLTVQFINAETVAAIALAGTGSGFTYTAGTCAPGAYTAGQTCTLNVAYTPTAVGLQKGAVVLSDATGANIVTASLSGVGLGAVQTNDPGTITPIGSTFTNPEGVAVDSANNVYIADAGANDVLMFAPGASTGTPVGTGLSNPTSVALDSAGNLYIADSGHGRVVEVPNVAGTLTTSAQTVIMSKLGSALGIATDLNGDLYIADSTNGDVLELGAIDGIPSSSASSLVGLSPTFGTSVFTAPVAVATDSTGNLFVADTTANTVTEIAYYGKQIINIGSGYLHPSGLATDASGSLYVADSGNQILLKIPFESSIFNTNDEYVVSGSIAAPYGVALDASANLYVVDSQDAAAYAINRAQGTLALGRANIGTSTSTQSGYIGNAGNLKLTFGNPDYVATGDTSDFTVASPSGNGCTNSESLSPATACVISASFESATIGNYSELLSFSSNASNTLTPSLDITATALNQSPSTTSLAQTSPAGTAAFGQSVTITATITSTKAGTPTGTVGFSVDGGHARNVTLTGNTAQITLTGLTGGQHTVSATYAGDLLYAPSFATIKITVAQAGSSVSLVTSTGFENPPSQQPGQPVTFVGTVTAGASTTPTGTITFSYNGKALSAPIPVGPTSANTTAAQLVISTLPAGTDTVVATYSGDINYAGSSTSLVIIITPETFTVSPTSASATVTAGQSTTLGLQFVSLAGYGGYVGLSCTGLPANTVCGFSPNGFLLQASNQVTSPTYDSNGIVVIPATYGPLNATVTIITGTTPTVPQPPVGTLGMLSTRGGPITLAFLGLAPLTLLIRRRAGKQLRRALSLLAVVVMFGCSALFSGCGNTLVGVTPPGTYHVTIRAVSTASTYTGAYAPGCSTTPANGTSVTCEQDIPLTLTVQ